MNPLEVVDLVEEIGSFLTQKEFSRLACVNKTSYKGYKNKGYLRIVEVHNDKMSNLPWVHRQTLQDLILCDVKEAHIKVDHYPRIVRMFNLSMEVFPYKMEKEITVLVLYSCKIDHIRLDLLPNLKEIYLGETSLLNDTRDVKVYHSLLFKGLCNIKHIYKYTSIDKLKSNFYLAGDWRPLVLTEDITN